MIKIRYGVFETNSSSVHSLCIAENEQIEKLKNEELLVKLYGDSVISYEDALKELIEEVNRNNHEEDKKIIENGNKEEIYQLMREYDIAETLDSYLDSEWLEAYEESYTTEHGDKILIFGLFGRDG